jgi:hypothetical protein
MALIFFLEAQNIGGARLWSQYSGGRGRRISEFKASLVYKVSSRTARAIQRNPVSKKKKNYYQYLTDAWVDQKCATENGFPVSSFCFVTAEQFSLCF